MKERDVGVNDRLVRERESKREVRGNEREHGRYLALQCSLNLSSV